MPASLSELPPELVLHILQYLPIPSLQAVSQISSEWHNFCQRNQSTIYHQAALLHQFISSLNITLSEAKCNFPVKYIEETPDWRSFCIQLFKLNRAWAGKGPALYRMSTRSGEVVHRIKVDERARFLITTHMIGGIKVVDLDTDVLLWHLPETYVRSWAHCEYENGFLIFDRLGEFKEVWRLTSDFDLSPPVMFHAPDDLQKGINDQMTERYRGCSDRGQFRPWALLQTSEWGRAFRFVYPILLVSSSDKAYLYNVETGNLVQTIKDTQAMVGEDSLGDINYVELNESYVFICGTQELRVFNRSNGAIALRITNETLESVPHVQVETDSRVKAESDILSLAFIPGRTKPNRQRGMFIGAHVHGNDLVGLLLDDRMLLIRDFPSIIKGKKQLVEAALEIAFSDQSPLEWQRSIYVAFEHGRVGVITSSGLFVFTVDGTVHCVTDPDVRCTYDCLGGTAFPHLIGTRIASVTDSQDLFQVVSCLQLTERGVYVTLDHRYIPELIPKGKQRQPSGGSEKDESSGQEEAMVVPFDEELAVPGSYIDNEGTAGGPTGIGLSNQELAHLLLQAEPGQDEDIDDQDEPITIYTAHVNTEDEEQFFEDDEDVDEVFADDGHECHSVVWVDYSPE